MRACPTPGARPRSRGAPRAKPRRRRRCRWRRDALRAHRSSTYSAAYGSTRQCKLRRPQEGSRLFETVVAVNELVADGDRGDTSHTTVVCLGGGLPQLVLDGLGLDRLEDGVRMELARRGGDE